MSAPALTYRQCIYFIFFSIFFSSVSSAGDWVPVTPWSSAAQLKHNTSAQLTAQMNAVSLIASVFLIVLFSCLGFKSSCRKFHFTIFNLNKVTPSTFNVYTSTQSNELTTEQNQVSFVRDVMRPYAMKLHSRDQAPKEGKVPAQAPFTSWEPTREGYLHFLIDSLAVYDVLEEIVHSLPELESLKDTGLERSQALREDIAWILDYDRSIVLPECGPYGRDYANFLRKISNESIPKFVCHYYNQYFAHTAGGLMIGKRMSDKLLEGKTLNFYKWSNGDVKILLDNTRQKIDEIALTWNDAEKEDCLSETQACFIYGGSLMTYIKPPPSNSSH